MQLQGHCCSAQLAAQGSKAMAQLSQAELWQHYELGVIFDGSQMGVK